MQNNSSKYGSSAECLRHMEVLVRLNFVDHMDLGILKEPVKYFSGKQNEVLKTPGTVLGAVLLLTGLPTLFLGIYWSPLATWVQNSLVFFIQTI